MRPTLHLHLVKCPQIRQPLRLRSHHHCHRPHHLTPRRQICYQRGYQPQAHLFYFALQFYVFRHQQHAWLQTAFWSYLTV